MNYKTKICITPIDNQLKKNNPAQSTNTMISSRTNKTINKIPTLSKNIQSKPLHTPSTTTSTKYTSYVTATTTIGTVTDKQHVFVDPNENDNAKSHYTNTNKIHDLNPAHINIQHNTNIINIPDKTTSFATITANEKNPSRE